MEFAVLFFIVFTVVCGVLAFLTGLHFMTIAWTLFFVGVTAAIYMWVSLPFRTRAAKRRREARIVALRAEGFVVSHHLKEGDTDVVFDDARQEFAIVGAKQTERFRYDQLDNCEWHYHTAKHGIWKLECTIRTMDPSRPLFKWWSRGKAIDGERWAQQVSVIVRA